MISRRSLSRTYRRCKGCNNLVPRKVYDKIIKKVIINKDGYCENCKEKIK